MTKTKRASALILAIAIFGDATTVFAQAPMQVPAASSPVGSAAVAAPASVTDANTVRILVGRSAILDVGAPIARVSLTSPDVADAMVTTPSQLLVNGKVPGTISMFVWDRGGVLRRYEVTVGRDLGQLSDQMRQLFPGERIEVHNNGKNVVLAGVVSNKDISDKVANVASGFVEKKDDVVNLLQVSPSEGNQVLLRVRFAEVSRTAMTELGLSLAANGYKDGRWFGRSTTQQFAAPQWDQDGKFVFSDFLNLFLFDTKNQIAGVLKALQNKGLFQSLAEPNLVAESGKEASFLAGGEIPVPVAQGSGANIGVSIIWKEFGVRLNFTPEVNGNRIHLKVKPEVSTLDYSNAVTLAGFRVPALSTRKTETQLELQDGQTFAIAGLINNQVTSTMQKIPGIGDIPVLGNLFKSKAAQKDQTELVVMITPEILRTNSNGVTPSLPRTPERFLDPLPNEKTKEMPPPAYSSRRSGEATPAPAATPAAPTRTMSAPTPTQAAAAVSSLTPAGPKVNNAPAQAAKAEKKPAAARPQPAPAPAHTPTVAVVPAPVSAPSPVPAPTPAAAPAPAVVTVPAAVPAVPVDPTAAPAFVTPSPEPPAAFMPPANAPMPNPAGVPSAAVSVRPAGTKPASKEETAMLERALKEQQARDKAALKAKTEENKRADAAAQKQAAKDQAEAEKMAKAQEQKDIKAAKKQAEADRKRAEEEAKRAAETSKKQAAVDEERAKAMDQAAAQLRVAQQAYDVEVAKQGAAVVASTR